VAERQPPANTYEALPEAQPEAIVIFCSNPRFQTAFEGFVEQELELRQGQFVPFVIAGGAGVLGQPERLPKEFKFMRDRPALFRRHFPCLKRVVLINHEDCAYYRMLAEKLPGLLPGHASDPAHRAGADLPQVADVFNRLLSHLGLQTEYCYTRFADADRTRVVFDLLPDGHGDEAT
jgi:hypothetical protein